MVTPGEVWCHVCRSPTSPDLTSTMTHPIRSQSPSLEEKDSRTAFSSSHSTTSNFCKHRLGLVTRLDMAPVWAQKCPFTIWGGIALARRAGSLLFKTKAPRCTPRLMTDNSLVSSVKTISRGRRDGSVG